MVKKTKIKTFYEAVGRRKSATSRVRLYLAAKGEADIFGNKVKKGAMIVNKIPIENYFNLPIQTQRYLTPLKLTNCLDRFAMSAVVSGGGKEGQLEAICLGLSRALVLVDPGYRAILKKAGLLTVDARVRERRKPGTGGKARRKKQSPKR